MFSIRKSATKSNKLSTSPLTCSRHRLCEQIQSLFNPTEWPLLAEAVWKRIWLCALRLYFSVFGFFLFQERDLSQMAPFGRAGALIAGSE